MNDYEKEKIKVCYICFSGCRFYLGEDGCNALELDDIFDFVGKRLSFEDNGDYPPCPAYRREVAK